MISKHYEYENQNVSIWTRHFVDIKFFKSQYSSRRRKSSRTRQRRSRDLKRIKRDVEKKKIVCDFNLRKKRVKDAKIRISRERSSISTCQVSVIAILSICFSILIRSAQLLIKKFMKQVLRYHYQVQWHSVFFHSFFFFRFELSLTKFKASSNSHIDVVAGFTVE